MRPSLSAKHLPRGFAFAATACGLKKTGLDLGLMVSEAPTSAACLFTTNRVQAAPVFASRMHLRKSRHRMRAIIVNSGNANCATGAEGISAAATTALKTAWELGRYHPSQVLVCSTGVIGVPLPWKKLIDAIPRLVRKRTSTPQAFRHFARAIMTTDTSHKWAVANCSINGVKVRLLGCAKGAGMIHPNMATMLSFIATDATIAPSTLSRALHHAADRTFNAITIDGDTSTNDTLAVLANGASLAVRIGFRSKNFAAFQKALEFVCRSLALQIVADGEGVKRVVEIEVRGAASDRQADTIARTIANSPLVKTALSGGDPNWGRILAAAGRAGVKFDAERIEIRMAGMRMCRAGCACPFDERVAHRKLMSLYVPVVVDLHEGKGSARILTCDFTQKYVRINASYRT